MRKILVLGTLRGLASKIQRTSLQATGETRVQTYASCLERALIIYNNTKNETGFSPNEIQEGGAEIEDKARAARDGLDTKQLNAYVKKLGHNAHLPIQPKLAVGMLVRKAIAGIDYDEIADLPVRQASSFKKEHSLLQYTTQVYRITEIVWSFPVLSYRIARLDGTPVEGSYTATQLLPIPSESEGTSSENPIKNIKQYGRSG